MQTTTWSVWPFCHESQTLILYCLYAVRKLKLFVIWSREESAIQRFLMYSTNGVSIQASVFARYRAGVRNSEVSAKRGSTVHM